MDDSERLFAGVWLRLTSDWGRLTTYRQMGVLGEDAAREAIHRSNTHLVQQKILHGELQAVLNDREAFITEGHHLTMPAAMTEAAVQSFRSTLHASTLVFAHSILDAAVFDCLRISALREQACWAERVAARKFALSDVATRPYAELLADAILSELERLERESLLAKVDRAFQICQPKKEAFLTNGFRFSRERLERLDALRHEVVHSPGSHHTFDTIYEDLQFMQSLGLHVFCMVGERFKVKLDSNAMFSVRTTGSTRTR